MSDKLQKRSVKEDSESFERIYDRFMRSTTICDETDRAHLALTLRCNNNCLFCLQGHHPGAEHKGFDDIKTDIDAAASSGLKKIVLSGGEPTLHPDYIKIVKYCKSSGIPHVQTISNGRMFSLSRFARSAAISGLTEVTLSIHGKDAKTHDFLVNVPGAFSQISKAIKNLKAEGIIISVDVGIFEQNYKQLPEIVKMIHADFGLVCDIDLIGPTLQGNAKQNHSNVMPRYSDVEPYLKEALRYCRDNKIVCWVLRVPMKYMGGYEFFKEGEEKLVEMAISVAKDFNSVPFICKGQRCEFCRFEDICKNIEAIEDRMKKDYPRTPSVNLRVNYSSDKSLSILKSLEFMFDDILIDVDEPVEVLETLRQSKANYRRLGLLNPKDELSSVFAMLDEGEMQKTFLAFDIQPTQLSLQGINQRSFGPLEVFDKMEKFSGRLSICANIMISRRSLSHLAFLVEKAISHGANMIVFKYLPLYNHVEKEVSWDHGVTLVDKDKIFYDLSSVEEIFSEAISKCNDNNVAFKIVDFPMCVFSDTFLERNSHNIEPHEFLTDLPLAYFTDNSGRSIADYISFIHNSLYRVRIRDCDYCKFQDRCAGFDSVYLKYKSVNDSL
ncbi:MAG: radical SAM protein [Candidatus Woesearchaeota archaeon]